MLTLGTPRLLFATTPVAVMRERLAGADFLADVTAGPRGTTAETCRLGVRFPEEWPGEDALSMLPLWIAQRERPGDPGPWSDGVVIRREDRLAIGGQRLLDRLVSKMANRASAIGSRIVVMPCAAERGSED